jgi:outer membrane beta-barrel protein
MGQRNASRINIFLVATMLASGPIYAQSKGASAPAAAPAAATPKGSDQKVDISDLENKYWAPKDTDFSVVQNRTYTKEKRFFITPQWGRPVNDSWSSGNVFGVTANYFFSERMGLQAMYWKANLKDNDAISTLRGPTFGSGAAPDHGKINSYYGVGYNFVPFYAKMSVWGKKIIYFDMAFTPTIGYVNYDQQIQTGNRTKGALSYGFDVTQYFFFSNWVAIRADLKNTWHNEEIVKYKATSAGQAAGDKVKDQLIQDTMFMFGLSFFY